MEEDCRDPPRVGILGNTEKDSQRHTQRQTGRKTETEVSQCFCIPLDGGGGSRHFHQNDKEVASVGSAWLIL